MALMHAAIKGNDECVNLLLEEGADVNLETDFDEDALILAAANGHSNCLEALIRAVGSVNKLHGNYSALMRAAENGKYECVDLLIKAGADVNRCCSLYGDTALHRAARKGYWEPVRMLVEAGADVNQVDKTGSTALLDSARCGFDECLAALIEAGADVNATHNDGHSALHLSAANNHCKCLTVLIAAGADVNACTADGVSILMNAARNGHYASIQLLLKSGIYINRIASNLGNALTIHLSNKTPKENVSVLLYTAGEHLEGIRSVRVPKFLKFTELKLCLKNLCREAIRKHLIRFNLHSHLFNRIPQLRLPRTLSAYVLYHINSKMGEVK